MAILVANIGTSDLAIELDGYYIPIGFDRTEPNIVNPEAGSPEVVIWAEENRREKTQQLYRELGFADPGQLRWSVSFRDLTQKLSERYKAAPETWHDRILPGRLWGVIKAALQLNLTEIHLFTTDQDHKDDTVHLFKLIQYWLMRELQNEGQKPLRICAEIIDFNAIDQDQLFGRYYNFFQSRPVDEVLLLSIKGGTPQMQIALRVQANVVGSQRQISLEPKLVVTDVLQGKPSECRRVSFWRYTRIQKYQAIERLLQRWDFAGAIALLQDWKAVLDFLGQHQVVDADLLTQSQVTVDHVTQLVLFAQHQFNLDARAAATVNDQCRKIPEVRDITEPIASQYFQQRDQIRALNLFTQCRILWKLEQVATFFARLGSCCESALEAIIKRRLRKNSDLISLNWEISPEKVQALLGDSVWETFKLLENDYYRGNFTRDNFYRISGRFSKRNFARVLFGEDIPQARQWEEIESSLVKLDFWINQRNNIMHSAQGVSKESMWEKFNDRADREVICPPDQILSTLNEIISSPLVGLDLSIKKPFVQQSNYYIYTPTFKRVKQLLSEDLKRATEGEAVCPPMP